MPEPFRLTMPEPEGDRRTRYQYTSNGGGTWHPCTPAQAARLFELHHTHPDDAHARCDNGEVVVLNLRPGSLYALRLRPTATAEADARRQVALFD